MVKLDDENYYQVAAKIFLGGPNAYTYGDINYENVVKLHDIISKLYKELQCLKNKEHKIGKHVCCDCNEEWPWSDKDYKCKCMRNKEHKMTREEAIKKCMNVLGNKKIELGDIVVSQLVNMVEALGLLKFEEEKKVRPLIDKYKVRPLIDKYCGQYGTIRLEEWPEGLVLWVGGEIKWRSWKS